METVYHTPGAEELTLTGVLSSPVQNIVGTSRHDGGRKWQVRVEGGEAGGGLGCLVQYNESAFIPRPGWHSGFHLMVNVRSGT